jgi:crotonyl-CoA carboxylase/reductase
MAPISRDISGPESAVPPTMQAWIIREERHGAPAEAMRLEEVSVPDIGPDDALIAVKAAGANFNGAWPPSAPTAPACTP